MGKHTSVEFKAGNYLSPRHWPMWCMIGLLRLTALLPYRGALAVGGAFGRVLFWLSGKRQRIVDTNLARCFPKMSSTDRERVKRACYRNIGISLIEMAICWWWADERLRPLVEIRGQEHVEALRADGRGVILLTGHYTSLEIGGRLLALFMPLQAMYRTQRNDLFDSFLFMQRCRYLANVVSRKQTRKLVKGIRDGLPTWYAPDQDFARERNVFAPFMGIAAATITASSRLAQSSGAAMLPYYPERRTDGSGYILHIEPPLADFPSDDDLADATTVNRSIEKYARRQPENYMWIHKRFKTRPPGEPPFYG